MEPNNINEEVRLFIKALHMPQSHIAKALEVTPQTVNRWVKGKAKVMQHSNLMALAELGNCDIEFDYNNTSIKFHKKESNIVDEDNNDIRLYVEMLDRIEALHYKNSRLIAKNVDLENQMAQNLKYCAEMH